MHEKEERRKTGVKASTAAKAPEVAVAPKQKRSPAAAAQVAPPAVKARDPSPALTRGRAATKGKDAPASAVPKKARASVAAEEPAVPLTKRARPGRPPAATAPKVEEAKPTATLNAAPAASVADKPKGKAEAPSSKRKAAEADLGDPLAGIMGIASAALRQVAVAEDSPATPAAVPKARGRPPTSAQGAKTEAKVAATLAATAAKTAPASAKKTPASAKNSASEVTKVRDPSPALTRSRAARKEGK